MQDSPSGDAARQRNSKDQLTVAGPIAELLCNRASHRHHVDWRWCTWPRDSRRCRCRRNGVFVNGCHSEIGNRSKINNICLLICGKVGLEHSMGSEHWDGETLTSENWSLPPFWFFFQSFRVLGNTGLLHVSQHVFYRIFIAKSNRKTTWNYNLFEKITRKKHFFPKTASFYCSWNSINWCMVV